MNSIRTSRPVRRIVSLLIALAATLGVTLMASPAQAASYGTITACFQSSATTQYGTYWGPYGLGGTANVDAYYGGAWHAISTVSTNTNGCASISVTTGYYWRMRVYDYRRPYRYVGTSPYAWVASSGVNYSLGTTRLASVYVG